jgi:flotillin
MAILALVIIAVVALLATAMVVKNVLYVCQPNEVLVFSGRQRLSAGREVSYRIIKGGRALRVPIIETVDRMDLTNMIIEVTVRNAYSKGGIPLMVQGVANIKVPGEEPLIHNALERHLGKSRDEIMKIARETLEGNLRGVLATLTPEQVNQDKEAFAGKLAEEAEHDLNSIGLALDTLKIQNVADEVGYLDALGRMRSAEIRRNAYVAEAQAQAEAAEVKWDNHMQGEVAKLDAQITVARKENERRIADARTRRGALIAEERAEVQAGIAQATAETAMQNARIEQVRLQLQADVVRPADARMREDQAKAKADAAKIIEQGKATAQVLQELATTYRASGDAGRDVLLMQQLVPLLQKVSGTIGDLKVDRLTIIGKGEASTDGDDPLAARIVNATEQIKAATGVDVSQVLRDRTGTTPRPGGPPRTPGG